MRKRKGPIADLGQSLLWILGWGDRESCGASLSASHSRGGDEAGINKARASFRLFTRFSPTSPTEGVIKDI